MLLAFYSSTFPKSLFIAFANFWSLSWPNMYQLVMKTLLITRIPALIPCRSLANVLHTGFCPWGPLEPEHDLQPRYLHICEAAHGTATHQFVLICSLYQEAKFHIPFVLEHSFHFRSEIS